MGRISLVTAKNAMVHLEDEIWPTFTACQIDLTRFPGMITDREVDCMACIVFKQETSWETSQNKISEALNLPKEILFPDE